MERVHRIQKAGLDVWCGMIVGFDNDDSTIFAAQRRFIRGPACHAMIGMLSAIPKTPLYARLAEEGRLDLADESEFGTNVIPLRMSREELRDGYVKLMQDLYEPEAYFGRLEDLYLKGRFAYGKGRAAYLLHHPWAWLKAQAVSLVTSFVLFRRLMRGIPEATLRQEYRKRVWRLLRVRPEPSLLLFYIYRCAMHYHQYTMAMQMTLGQSPIYNSF